jgi:hypothetical protein
LLSRDRRRSRWSEKETKTSTHCYEAHQENRSTKVRSRLRTPRIAAILALNTRPAFAQAFNSTELKTGISNSLAVIMMFGFVLGIAAVIYGGFAIRRGDVDQGKMSIIGGAIIAAAPAVIFAFFKIFGIDGNSSVGVGNF